MKNYKIMTLMLVVTLLTGAVLSGCEAGRPLFEFYGDMVKAWEKSYDRDSPDALTVYIEHDGVTEAPQVITSTQVTNEVFGTLSSMRVTGEYISQGVASDAEPDTVIYQFRSSDGGTVEFTFKGGHAVIGDKLYICSGVEELFGIGGIDLSALDATASPPADSMPPAQSSEYADQPQPQEPQQPATNINLVEYDGGYFTVMLPEGWQIQTMGQYTTFGFRAWNPQNPDYEIFYYGNLGPLNKSYDAKNGWAGYIGNMGFPNAELNYDAPVVTMDSGSSVFYVFDELQAVSDKYGFGFSLPALGDLMPQTSIPIETAYAGASTGETMIFAGVRGSNGGACGGMFMASLWNTNPYYVGGVDMTPTSAMNVVGIIAPTEDFLNVEAVLTQAVFSLRFTDKYIQDGIAYSKAVGEAAMADNAARQAVFDRANKAWSEYFRGGPTAGGDDFNRRIDEINDMLDNIRFALD